MNPSEPKPKIYMHPNFVHLRERDMDDLELWKQHHVGG